MYIVHCTTKYVLIVNQLRSEIKMKYATFLYAYGMKKLPEDLTSGVNTCSSDAAVADS